MKMFNNVTGVIVLIAAMTASLIAAGAVSISANPTGVNHRVGAGNNSPVGNTVPLSLVSTANTIMVNQTFSIHIQTNVSDSQPVDGVEVYITFDPAKLAVVDADSTQQGIQIMPGNSLPFVLANTVSNSSGLISYSAGALNLPFPTGNFTVATIQFLAKEVTDTPTAVSISTSGLTTTSKVDDVGVSIEGTPVDASVQIIPGADVNIRVTLQGGSRPEAGWVVPLTVKFFTPGASAVDVLTATPAYTFELTTVKDGSRALAQAAGITGGTYDISVVSAHCLTNVKRGVSISGLALDVDMGTLLEGDANGDNMIDIHDFGILSAAYGKGTGDAGFDARADFDRNGRISISDFGLVAANFAKTAPQVVNVP